MFIDRKDAGQQLAEKLIPFAGRNCMVLGIPRGGIPIAREIALRLHAELAILPVKKIGHPLNKEYAIGAIGPRKEYIIPHEDVSEGYIHDEKKRIRMRISEMEDKFGSRGHIEACEGKTIIITDDGIATGNTVIAGIEEIKYLKPAEIIVASPVISASAYAKINPLVNQIIALDIADQFRGVGAFYYDFHQVSDEEVMEILLSVKTQKYNADNPLRTEGNT